MRRRSDLVSKIYMRVVYVSASHLCGQRSTPRHTSGASFLCVSVSSSISLRFFSSIRESLGSSLALGETCRSHMQCGVVKNAKHCCLRVDQHLNPSLSQWTTIRQSGEALSVYRHLRCTDSSLSAQRDDRIDPYATFPIHARPRPATDVFADGVQRTQ